MEYFLGFVFICLVLGAVGIVYGKGKDEKINIPSGRLGRAMVASMDISEPVISIVESFKEKGRWKVKPLFDLFTHQNTLYSFEIRDSRTGETHNIYSHRCYYYYTETKQLTFPDKIHSYSSPSWMTTEEWDYVCVNAQRYMDTINERFKVIKDRKVKTSHAQAKVNQEKERQRLISIYCKEEV